LVLSGAWLYAFPSPTLFYVSLILVHLLIGLVALVPIAAWWLRLLRSRTSYQDILGWTLLVLGGVLGVVLVFTGATRPFRWLLYGHIALVLAGVAVIAVRTAARGRLTPQPALGSSPGLRSSPGLPRAGDAASSGGAAVTLMRYGLAALALAALALAGWNLREKSWQARNVIANRNLMPPASMDGEGDGPAGPFFPSSAQTLHKGKIPAKFFMQSDSCRRCHADIYREWSSSAHHFSSFNNQWYRKSIEYMQEVVGTRPSKWCGGCHDPAVLYSGLMDTPIKQIINRPESQAGLGCMMCHSIAQVKSTMGQGDFYLEYPKMHELAASENPVMRRLHDFVTYLNPEPHRRAFLKPFMRQQPAEFCSTCHKVHLDVPVNHYRWIRGFNDYDNWQASGVSGQGARSFYYPKQPQNCADCHMPLRPSRDAGNIGGFVHSHRFPAANTALPFANQDEQQRKTVESFLKNGILSVDIFALSPAGTLPVPNLGGGQPELATEFAVGEEAETIALTGASGAATTALTAPLGRAAAAARAGDSVRLDVVVRTRKIGHFFPAGTVDAFDVWLEMVAADEQGRVLFWSGKVEDGGKGPVERGAHFYRSLLVDAHGHFINKRNAWATRAVVYVRLIPPGAADVVHYRLKVPRNARGKINLTASLNYRKFSWYNTHFSYAGIPDVRQAVFTPDFDDRSFVFRGDTAQVSGKLKYVPDLPTATLAEGHAELAVLAAGSPQPAPRVVLQAADWERWNDYGIGLLLQGDFKGAEAAFRRATEIAPDNPDGWVNMGRAQVQEGELEGAQQSLERALRIAPWLARAHFFYGRVLREQGNYGQAETHLLEVLAQYPRDRVARNELGRIFFLSRRYQEAVREFEQTLSIDPEDLQAHYNLMLCYNGLGNGARARQHQLRYLRFKADEASQTITGPYRQRHPEDNNERQAIHEHLSVALIEKPK